REPSRVTEIENALTGDEVEERAHDGESAETAVEDADGTLVKGHLSSHGSRARYLAEWFSARGAPHAVGHRGPQSVGLGRRDDQQDPEADLVGGSETRVEDTG